MRFDWTRAAAAAFSLGLLAGATPAAAAEVEEANLRWRGATCRLRLPLVIGKGTDSEGRSHSPWYTVSEHELAFRFHVSDRDRIARLLDGKTLRPGTTFTCDGWRMVDPKKSHGGLWLDLRFAGLPVTAQVEFWMKKPGRNFADAERYMRVDAFQLQAMDEKLVEAPLAAVSTPPPAGPAVAPPAPGPRSPQVSAGPSSPAVRMVAVAVQPARVPPGGEIAMVITYEVSGVPPGSAFEVLELREVYQGGRRLAGFEERLPRASDTFTSSQPLRLPSDLAPGLYSLRAKVVMAGREATGSALFQVTAAP